MRPIADPFYGGAEMIRAQVLKTIREALNRPPWILAEDFAITPSEGSDGSVTIVIKFVSGDDQFFRATIPNSKSKRVAKNIVNIETVSYDFDIECEFDPGEILRSQSSIARGEDSLIKQIGNWVGRVLADIQSAPVARAVLSHEEMIRQLEEKLKDAPDEYPSAEQVTELQKGIDQVKESLAARIAELEKNEEERERKLSELEEQMDALKERVEYTKIRATIRALAGRVYRVSTDPKTGALIENLGKLVSLLGAGAATS